MRVADFDYDLPLELIAQQPVEPRDTSRLMVIHRSSGGIEHRRFNEIVDYLRPGDCLILNRTRVIPARLWGMKKGTGALVEVVLLRPLGEPCFWQALVRPGKKFPPGSEIVFGQGELSARVVAHTDFGGRILELHAVEPLGAVLDRLGEMPLPPYIRSKLEDKERYQTVYAQEEGSAAAPTAGLHFTPRLLAELEQKGITIVKILLHVGLGTFRPVKVEEVEQHVMHEEYFEISPADSWAINRTREEGGRVVAVGTTVVRALETASSEQGLVQPQQGWTNIFIYPGYRFKSLDALVTNFHLPRSSLIMLVSAFAGQNLVRESYRQAVEQEYRFFSFGDAMLIL